MVVMATITTEGTSLRITLSTGERIAGLLRDVRVPLTSVRGVETVPDGLDAVRGVRAPGLGLPGHRAIGTWREPGATTLVSVRRGQPAVRVTLAGERHAALLVGSDDAGTVADAVRRAVAAQDVR